MNSRESVQTANLPSLQSLQDATFDTQALPVVTDAGQVAAILDKRAAGASITKGAQAGTPTRVRGKPGLKPGAGRKPSSGHYYTESLAVQIIRLVEQATPIADYLVGAVRKPGIGSQVGVPPNIIHNWLRNEGSVRKGEEHLRVDGKFQVEGKEFAQSFARAREVAADTLADEMLALARHLNTNPGAANAVRVQADILRWQAVTRYRTRYGDSDEAKRPAPQVVINIGSHSPTQPKIVGSGSIGTQIEHSQPQAGRIIPGQSATNPPRPTDTGSVRRGGVTVQATSTGLDPAGQGAQAGRPGGAGA